MGSYDILEREHGYIQWLFPIREQGEYVITTSSRRNPHHSPGMNFQSQPLYPHEIQKMKHSAEVQQRFIQSYQLMLDFYGMKLASEDTGKLERSSNDPSHASYYVPRYQNLLSECCWLLIFFGINFWSYLGRSHNNLRITRILKSLSEMGLERFNAGFLLHVLSEQSDPDLRELRSHRLYSSMDGWWANCMRDNADREWVLKTIEKVRTGKIVFTRAMYESALERRRLTGSFAQKWGSQDFQAVEAARPRDNVLLGPLGSQMDTNFCCPFGDTSMLQYLWHTSGIRILISRYQKVPKSCTCDGNNMTVIFAFALLVHESKSWWVLDNLRRLWTHCPKFWLLWQSL